MPALTTLRRIVEAYGLELRLELSAPGGQREAAERAALERTTRNESS